MYNGSGIMKFLDKINLKNMQRKCDKLYEEEGLTDRVLEMQVEINTRRHELDIHDPNDVLYHDPDGNDYVQ